MAATRALKLILTAKQKAVYRRHRQDGVSQVQIAAELGISPSAVCTLLARAEARLAKLRERFPELVDMSLL